MTGFARTRDTVQGVDVTLSVKTVNHRGLDIHFYMGVELDPFENAMRTAVKRALGRGHIDVRVQLTRSGSTGPLAVDAERLDAYIGAFRQAAARHGLSGEPDLNTAFRVPGILCDSASVELTAEFEAPLIALLESTLAALNSFREREGTEIQTILLERAAAVHSAAEQIEVLRKGALPAYQNRLRERLADLLSGPSGIDPQRLVQEAALLADRSDIGEEVERLKIHSRQLDDLLRGSSDVGKKLDFVLQEMNRETNTILSKTSGLGEPGLRITELAVNAKSEIERMREQALNLE